MQWVVDYIFPGQKLIPTFQRRQGTIHPVEVAVIKVKYQAICYLYLSYGKKGDNH